MKIHREVFERIGDVLSALKLREQNCDELVSFKGGVIFNFIIKNKSEIKATAKKALNNIFAHHNYS